MTINAQQFVQEADRTRQYLSSHGCFEDFNTRPRRATSPAVVQKRTKDGFRSSEMRLGEVLMKCWVATQAKLLGLSPHTIWMRLYRRTMPWPKTMRKVSTRRIYVQADEPAGPFTSGRSEGSKAAWRTRRKEL